MDISDYRREYMSEGLNREALDNDPFKQFETWFQQADKSGVKDSNAFSLATANERGAPSIRTVLLKSFDFDGFVFFTNYTSRKSTQISENPMAGMLFPWLSINRQIIVEGSCEKISKSDSLKYFLTRPRGSQLGAWCSDQSSIVESRMFLEQKYQEASDRFKSGSVPLPPEWGGYRIIPSRIEFWQGRENRLHDRFQYIKNKKDVWSVERLAP